MVPFMPASKWPGAWQAKAYGPGPSKVTVTDFVDPPVIPAISGVPFLSPNASAIGPTMNSCSMVPVFLIWNVTVSPLATGMSMGMNISESVAVITTTRGWAFVPGVKLGVALVTGVAVAADGDDEPAPELQAASIRAVTSRPADPVIVARRGIGIANLHSNRSVGR